MISEQKIYLNVIRWSAQKAYDDYQGMLEYLEEIKYPEMGELEKSVFESFQQLAAETFEFKDRIFTLLKQEEA